ncbi:DUF3634 family protein [Shewanella surugensis]|uniref:DUF3634 family protein n=1 Tax=Shewanella surugensis TaxID=212020 RepID=A0ABT0L7Y4_9GAMM|nr:DUF3634 family protein [Shewanella surugensis]MCL1123809.1 DUF3634 family protein [Shewanella surugensis]
MTLTILKIAFVLLGVALIYLLIFSGKKGLVLFEMHFKQGRLASHKGKIPDKFEKECRAIAKTEKLTCSIKCERLNSVRLNISANVCNATTQRIRNLFPFEYYDKKQIDNSKKSS